MHHAIRELQRRVGDRAYSRSQRCDRGFFQLGQFFFPYHVTPRKDFVLKLLGNDNVSSGVLRRLRVHGEIPKCHHEVKENVLVRLLGVHGLYGQAVLRYWIHGELLLRRCECTCISIGRLAATYPKSTKTSLAVLRHGDRAFGYLHSALGAARGDSIKPTNQLKLLPAWRITFCHP